MKRILMAAAVAYCVSLGYVPMSFARAEAPRAEAAGDVIARVGDQTITFSEVNTALNSSAIVGVSVPALGTPERDTVRITLLDRFVSANLMYLDARKQGVDKDPRYRRELERFDNATLADLYWQRQLIGEVAVTEEEIQAYYNDNIVAGTELTPDLQATIESKLRSDKVREQRASARSHIRNGVQVTVYEENLATDGVAERADSVVLADIDGEPLTWGSVKDRIVDAGKGAIMADPLAKEGSARRRALETEIDMRIMADKARSAGLDQERVYKARTGEFHKTRLINFHREQLVKQMMPTDEELKAFYEANKATFVVPEARKIQIVVLKTREEASQIREKIVAGDMTMYEAARDYSVAQTAKDDLGEMGWVNQGEAVPVLDAVIFALGPGEVSEPVETPTGWHLITVQDMREAKHTDFSEAATRKLIRHKYLDQKLDEYVVNLRKNEFSVEVYQDVLVRLAQQEADMVKELSKKAEEPSSVTQQRIEELKKFMNPSP